MPANSKLPFVADTLAGPGIAKLLAALTAGDFNRLVVEH
jgi:hypothetical protein